MSRITLWIVTCLLAAAPSAASGAVTLKIQDAGMWPWLGYVDLVFETSGPNDTIDEQLAFYDIGLRLVKRGGGSLGGMRFVEPYASRLPAAEGFVLSDAADFIVAEATPTSILVNAGTDHLDNHDITSGKKAGRVYFEIDPLTSLDSAYEIQFDPKRTMFAAGAGVDPVIPVTLAAGVFATIPEPAGLSVLSVGVLVLRRRR